jgi:hypothetical protein
LGAGHFSVILSFILDQFSGSRPIAKVGLYYDPRKDKPHIVRWYGDYEANTQKRKRYCKAFKLKRDAEDFKAQQAVSFKGGLKRDRPEEITLKTFCSDWKKTKMPSMRSTTMKEYEYVIDRMTSYFGSSMPLCKITPHMAAKFIAELGRLGKAKEGQPLSEWTRSKILTRSKVIFGEAVKWELLVKNPFKCIKSSKLITTKWHFLKPEDYWKLLAVAPSLRWKAMYALAYTAGLRFGELFSLAGNEVDFKKVR